MAEQSPSLLPVAEPDSHPTIYFLEIENELRVSVGPHQSTIQLLSGLAEIFGTEMKINEKYQLPPHTSIAVYTAHGCTIGITGQHERAYVSADTLNNLPVTLHGSFEERRIRAENENAKGPVVLIVGPTDVGKSTWCRLLLNYAARLGREPVFVDLDPGQSSLGVPGSMGFVGITKPADITQGFVEETEKLYYFGYESPEHKVHLYLCLLRQLGLDLRSHLRYARRNAKSSGVIINSCGWVRGQGYNAITFAAMAFEIDILCVLGDQELYAQLLNDIPSSVEVHNIPKMPGVVERSPALRSITCDSRIFNYFFAVNRHPFTIEVKFSEIHVLRVKSEGLTDDIHSTNASMDDIDFEHMTLSEQLWNQVLGLSSAVRVYDKKLLRVIGFVWVKHIDIGKGVITVYARQPSPLPSKILLLGNISWLG